MKRVQLLTLFCTATFLQAAYADTFKLVSYNIRNFDYDSRSHTPTNKKHLVYTIDQANPDLMAVQEINNKFEFEKMIDRNFQGDFETALSHCGGSHDQHLGFVYKTKALKLLSFTEDLRTVNVNSNQRVNSHNCKQGSRPVAIATFKKIDTNQIIIALSVHLKSGGQKNSINKRFKQLEVLSKIVSEYRAKGMEHFIIMGDFNSTEYIFRGTHQKRFSSLVKKMNLKDASEKISCSSYWWGNTNDTTQYPSVLDHILISNELTKGKEVKAKPLAHCASLNCQPTNEFDMGISFDEVSDHCPIKTEI